MAGPTTGILKVRQKKSKPKAMNQRTRQAPRASGLFFAVDVQTWASRRLRLKEKEHINLRLGYTPKHFMHASVFDRTPMQDTLHRTQPWPPSRSACCSGTCRGASRRGRTRPTMQGIRRSRSRRRRRKGSTTTIRGHIPRRRSMTTRMAWSRWSIGAGTTRGRRRCWPTTGRTSGRPTSGGSRPRSVRSFKFGRR